jgi:hypothetical protein
MFSFFHFHRYCTSMTNASPGLYAWLESHSGLSHSFIATTTATSHTVTSYHMATGIKT